MIAQMHDWEQVKLTKIEMETKYNYKGEKTILLIVLFTRLNEINVLENWNVLQLRKDFMTLFRNAKHWQRTIIWILRFD